MSKSEYTANIQGFSAFANVRTSPKAIVTVQFPLVKTAMYALSLLIILAIAKPFIL